MENENENVRFVTLEGAKSVDEKRCEWHDHGSAEEAPAWYWYGTRGMICARICSRCVESLGDRKSKLHSMSEEKFLTARVMLS